MTIRALIIGLAIAVFINAFCFFNDRIVRQGSLINDLMPTTIYGGVVFLVLVVNPLLARLRRGWTLTRRELAFVCGIALVAGSVASWGLWQFLPTTIMLPHHHVRTKPAWAHEKVLDVVPERMLPDVSGDESVALNGYVLGLAEGNEHISLGEVPWGVWIRPLCFWVPLGLAITIAVIGLAVVVHRQWIDHEHLPYPIPTFAHSLLPEEGRSFGDVFRNRLFWIGAGTVFAIHMSNWLAGLVRWYFVYIPLRLDFSSLSALVPTLVRGGGEMLFYPRVLFTVVGLSYFLGADISFSMGIMPFVFCFAYGWLASYGISVYEGHHMAVKMESYLFLGGYAAILLMMLYTGRHYYWTVLRRGLGIGVPGGAAAGEVGEGAIWGMRVFLAGTVLFIVQLIVVGLTWYLAILYTLLALTVWIVVSRAVAETGAMHIGTQIFPGAILWGLFGTIAIGPHPLIVMFLVSAVLLAGPGWAPMPFATQAFKLGDMSGVAVSRFATWAIAVVLIGTAISIPSTIYWQYDAGAMPTSGGWPMAVSTFSFENVVTIKQHLAAQGTTELAESLGPVARLFHLRPNGSCVIAFFVALAAALGFGLARLRFARWPLHPVVFVFLGGYQGKLLAWSFLLGWLVKAGISKYGGGKVYNDLKPLMIGLIAGEVFARFIPVVVGLLCYAVCGTGLE